MLFLYNLIPPEREVNYNLIRIHLLDQRTERTNRDMRIPTFKMVQKWNQLDITTQSDQTISEFKKRLTQLVRPCTKKSIFNVQDLDGVNTYFQKLSKKMESITYNNTVWSNYFRIQKETNTISKTMHQEIYL